MIVMKFGGSSLESPEAVHRVCTIVRSHAARRPVVVVSAAGKTTDHLIAMAAQASLGHGYSARKALHEVQDLHFKIAGELLREPELDRVEASFQLSFRELHGILHDVSEDGRPLTPALLDYVTSFGERLSSELVAAALRANRVPAVHVDSRDLIVTDARHGSAAPLDWPTQANLRRTIPPIADTHVVVMPGFIAATEDGATTTLGRGGSDLTASLVGAALAADEIQIWTDVDGMLTCDPRVVKGTRCVRSLSYSEAGAMAAAGAKVLHPHTVLPAVRQRIPLVIRNSRRPDVAGTSITSTGETGPSAVKGIAVTEHLLLLEMRSRDVATGPEFLRIMHDFCRRQNVQPALLSRSGDAVFLAFRDPNALHALEMELAGCVLARLRSNVALVTLVGEGIGANPAIGQRALTALRGTEPQIVSGQDDVQIVVAVAQKDARRACELLHTEFFASADPAQFAPVAAAVVALPPGDPSVAFAMRKTAVFSRYGWHPNQGTAR